jgi:NAD(P)-dependent dehydrogenase (short-subunit alcohol dehydrogenase family)
MTTWLITGCSTGLGRALATAVLAHGDNVVATARDVARVEDLARAFPDRALAAALDVTDADRVTAVMRTAEERFGQVDVLVNNAGYGYRAAVEEGEDEPVRTLFETHFFGTVAMIKAVLPGMRTRRTGTVVNISSIAARLTPAGSGYYAAVKAAVEGMSGSLRKELAPLGIEVIVVEPGAFRTDFAGRSLTQSAEPIADYADTAGKRRIENQGDVDGTQPGDPVKAAEAVITAVASPHPPAVLVLGPDAQSAFADALANDKAQLDAWSDLGATTNY